jgi:hypothetical protein
MSEERNRRVFKNILEGKQYVGKPRKRQMTLKII